jgi:hypothetical protein
MRIRAATADLHHMNGGQVQDRGRPGRYPKTAPDGIRQTKETEMPKLRGPTGTTRTVRGAAGTDFIVCFDRDGQIHRVWHRTTVMGHGASRLVEPRLAMEAMEAIKQLIEWGIVHVEKDKPTKASGSTKENEPSHPTYHHPSDA